MADSFRLEGCTPEPLIGYLKALGVLRLVCEGPDRRARGDWAGGTLRLHTRLTATDLIEYFVTTYVPTPVIVPWSGSDFFKVRNFTKKPPYKAPSSEKIVRAFLESSSPRFEEFRQVIRTAIDLLRECGIEKSEELKGATKLRYLSGLRSVMPDRFIEWFDAATVLEATKPTYSVLVGTTGGSDGNTHLSDNFMKNLWELLPDFDEQRPKPGRGQPRNTPDYSKALLANALFGTPTKGISDDKTASLYDPGATGGANAGHGFGRGPMMNPWDFVLALEGCVCLGGSITRRANAESRSSATFPFQVQLAAGTTETATSGEQVDREVWLPLWTAKASYPEVRQLLGEGRAMVGRKNIRRSGDVARAVAELGVDRGITSFQRFGIIRSRVGGDRYSAAIPLGRFEVRGQRNAELLREASEWIESFRAACRTKAEGAKADPPARFPTCLRQIDAAIFEFCKSGGQDRLAGVLRALGNAERELAVGDFPPDKRRTRRPLGGLSSDWISACDDGSAEHRLARGVAFIASPPDGKVPPLRAHLEPVERGKKGWAWAEQSRAAVWSAGSLARNLGEILARRIHDGERAGQATPLLASLLPVSLDDVSRFLAGQVDDLRLEELLWGFALAEAPTKGAAVVPVRGAGPADPLPRAYALLKLTLLPGRIGWVAAGERTVLRHFRRSDDEEGVTVRQEPAMLARLRAGDVAGACDVAVRRLRSAGFVPLPGPWSDGSRRSVAFRQLSSERLLASLLFPINNQAIDVLGEMVLRVPSADAVM